MFQVGSGRLKLNPEDARKDTPKGIKDLIQICSEYDRNKRLDFVEVNTVLRFFIHTYVHTFKFNSLDKRKTEEHPTC